MTPPAHPSTDIIVSAPSANKRAQNESEPDRNAQMFRPLTQSQPPLKRPRPNPPPPAPSNSRDGAHCPYMDTINRTVLDFDKEPICAISLSSHNIYACLVCSKYLQGRGPSTHAYEHSIEFDHHLFLNLTTGVVYCLPEGYRVHDATLSELSDVHTPVFTAQDILQLDTVVHKFRVQDASLRIRGVVGINNLGHTDYASVVFQLLLCIPPIRDFLLRKYASSTPNNLASVNYTNGLESALATLTRKLWASHAFRAHVSPHTLMQLVSRNSKNRFTIVKQADPVDFLAWLFNFILKLNQKTCAGQIPFSHCLRDTFQGEMQTTSIAKDGKSKSSKGMFWYLPLDLPPKPLFKDSSDRTLVAQVLLNKLLLKFDGKSRHHVVKTEEQRTYSIVRLPKYLILVIRRFTKTKFGIEKNPCVVHLPADELCTGDICPNDTNARYSLVCAVVHDGDPKEGHYHIAVKHAASNTWFDLDNMEVKSTLSQLVGLSNTYILLYARH